MTPDPTQSLLRRLREAMTLYELSRATPDVKDASLGVLVRDALDRHAQECDDLAAADEAEREREEEVMF